MIKRAWTNSGRFVGGTGVVLWICAILSQCGDAASPGFSASLFGIGIGLMFLGGWMASRSRRAVLIDHAVDSPPVTAKWIEESATVEVDQTHGIRTFHISFGESSVWLGRRRVRLGGDLEWTVRSSGRRAQLRSDGQMLAKARRLGRDPSRWRINDGTRDHWLECVGERSVDKRRSSKHLWGKDAHTVSRRRGTMSLSDGGAAVAVIELAYTLDSRLKKRFDGTREMSGSFVGEIEVRGSLPVPVVLLGLAITLGRWRRRPPQIGDWVVVPSSGG